MFWNIGWITGGIAISAGLKRNTGRDLNYISEWNGTCSQLIDSLDQGAFWTGIWWINKYMWIHADY